MATPLATPSSRARLTAVVALLGTPSSRVRLTAVATPLGALCERL
ncbi:hypothetical protein [Nonomuraea jabiensis]